MIVWGHTILDFGFWILDFGLKGSLCFTLLGSDGKIFTHVHV
jgi:hypothetical protein